MRVLFLSTYAVRAGTDNPHREVYHENQVYDLSEASARHFIRNGVAVVVEDAQVEPASLADPGLAVDADPYDVPVGEELHDTEAPADLESADDVAPAEDVEPAAQVHGTDTDYPARSPRRKPRGA